MRKITLLFTAAGLVTALTITGCSLLQQAGNQFTDPKHETITLVLPQWPEYLPELCGWKIQAQDSSTCKTVGSDSLKIKVNRNKPLCIKAQPITKAALNNQSCFFKCAGALYPYQYHVEKGTIELSWSVGYASNLMETLINSGAQAGYSCIYIEEMLLEFNWDRLLQTLESKQDENPWLLNTQQVLEGIANHNFSANKLKMSGTLPVTLDFPVYSSYVPENKAIVQNENQNQFCITIKKDQKELFALADDNFLRGVLISGTSVKNISLEFISLPIYIIGDI